MVIEDEDGDTELAGFKIRDRATYEGLSIMLIGWRLATLNGL